MKPSDIDKGWLLDLRGKRAQVRTRTGEPVKPATLKKDLLFIRLVLRYAKASLRLLQGHPLLFVSNTDSGGCRMPSIVREEYGVVLLLRIEGDSL